MKLVLGSEENEEKHFYNGNMKRILKKIEAIIITLTIQVNQHISTEKKETKRRTNMNGKANFYGTFVNLKGKQSTFTQRSLEKIKFLRNELQ